MMDINIRIDAPAVDRLAEALNRLAEALGSKAANGAAEPIPVTPLATDPVPADLAPAQVEEVRAMAEEMKPEPEPEHQPEPTVTLGQVQRAAAQLRDQGKLKAVTDMFPEFDIKKLSDLKGDKLLAFAERLRGLGASL